MLVHFRSFLRKSHKKLLSSHAELVDQLVLYHVSEGKSRMCFEINPSCFFPQYKIQIEVGISNIDGKYNVNYHKLTNRIFLPKYLNQQNYNIFGQETS